MKVTSIAATLLLILTLPTMAQGTFTLAHQGRVLANGAPLTGTGQFKFALVSAAKNLSKTAVAEAHVNIIGGDIFEILVTDGGLGYLTAPTITVTDATGMGSGAEASAVMVGGILVAVQVNNGGTGYEMPVVTIDPPPVNLGVEQYWSNDGTSNPDPILLPVNKGMYSVKLGDTTVANMPQGMDASHVAHSDVRLRISFSDGVNPFEQLSPDTELGGVAYALIAQRALGVSPGAIGNGELAADSASLGKITGGAMQQMNGKIGVGVGNPLERLEVGGRIVVGDSALPSPKAGTIRWTGKDFEGFNGARWVSLSSDPTVVTPVAGMVWIAPGSFSMGSPSFEVGRRADEGPQTSVTISRGFWMGSREVTQGEYLAVVGTNPSSNPGDLTRPVEWVSWAEAMNYCALLTAQERAAGRLVGPWAYRLPTEAEWEYAARAGTPTRFSYGDDLPDASNLGNYAWYDGNWTSGGATKSVGLKAPNAWGLYDMYGNAAEWCWDWYGPYPGGQVTDPTGAPGSQSKVQRGRGRVGINVDATGMQSRSAARVGEPTVTSSWTGFRVVLSPIQL